MKFPHGLWLTYALSVVWLVTGHTQYAPPYVEWTAPAPCVHNPPATECPPLADEFHVYRNGQLIGTQPITWGQQGTFQWPLLTPLANGEVIGISSYNRGTSTESIIPSVTVGGQIPPPTCLLSQFKVEYFNNVGLMGTPVMTACETPPLDKNWGNGGPGGGIPVDQFSLRATGTFAFVTGKTTFSVTTDDGTRLYFNGERIIDQWRDQAPAAFSAVRDNQSQNYPITVEYYENGGGAVLRASWTTAVTPPPPALTLTCPANLKSDTAVVNYPPPTPSGGTPPVSLSCAPQTGSTFPPGDTPVTCNAIDSLKATASCGFTVSTPLPPPLPLTLTCPSNITSESNVVTYPNPVVAGGVAPVTFTCAPPSGTDFPGGVSTVSCSAIDSAGTAAACGFTVTTPLPPTPPLDQQPPAVQITRIRRLGNSSNYRVTVDATDNVEVMKVTFSVDGIVQAMLTLPPYEASVRIATPGTHTILIEAMDQAGNTGSAQATLTR